MCLSNMKDYYSYCEENKIERSCMTDLVVSSNLDKVAKYTANYGSSMYLPEYLELACKFSDGDTVLVILELELHPTQKCFDNVLGRINFPRDLNMIYEEINYIEDIDEISILLEFGYKLTQDDFENLTKKLIYIEDYQKYGLTVDENIKNACNESMFYPYQ